MDTAIDLQVYTVRQIEELGLPYAVGGSMAAAAYGTPRFTRDVDIVVDLSLEQVGAFAARFPKSEFYIDEAVIREAVRQRGQFNIIHHDSGVKAHIYIPGDALQRDQIRRARRLVSQSGEASYSPPEELIIMKLEYWTYGQTQRHLEDIVNLLYGLGGQVDFARIEPEVVKRGLQEPWAAVQLRYKEAVAAKQAAEQERPAG